MFDIATRMSCSISILLRYFNLITATTEKPASHKYDVANGTRIWRALQPTSRNSDQALTQNEMSELGLYMLFKMRLEERSINCLASTDVNPWGAFTLSTKDFLSNFASPCLQKNISQNARLEHPMASTSHSSYHTHQYSAGRDCQIASLNGILKVENYNIARYLSADQFSTTAIFF